MVALVVSQWTGFERFERDQHILTCAPCQARVARDVLGITGWLQAKVDGTREQARGAEWAEREGARD